MVPLETGGEAFDEILNPRLLNRLNIREDLAVSDCSEGDRNIFKFAHCLAISVRRSLLHP